jgi:hypothetical protein
MHPAQHAYTAEAICLSLGMFLQGAVSFRGCQSVVQLLQGFLPQFRSAPAPNTIQSWLLRLGLHELRRPKEKADDWVLIVDHTLQLGPVKCLLIVGLRLSAWEQLEEPLSHHDLTLITLEPVAKSTGEIVHGQLEAAAVQVGGVRAILNDEGSDLTLGAEKFQENHSTTQILCDIAHKTAIVLKRELLADERWTAFTQCCGQTQPRVKQTELGHLAPPTQKVKGRYMNLGPLVSWGEKMLKLVETPETERPANINLTRLEEKFGWIRDFGAALADWRDLHAVKDCVLEYARREGYHADAADDLRPQLTAKAHTVPSQRMASALLEIVQQQSQGARPGESLPASSEVLESLIGKGKRMQGQHSRGGFTKMLLAMAASVVQITQERVCEALETIREVDLFQWCREQLGDSLTAQRRQALPTPTGTKTG